MSEPRYLPADAIVRVALWLHDRFCGKTDAAVRIEGDAIERHLIQDGWINAAVELLLLAREVDQ